MGSCCCCSSWDLQQTEAEAQPFGLRGSTRSARDTPCLHRVSFPLITLGFLTVLFLWFFFMSAINLLPLMRKHEFPWEESQPVVSHVIGAGAHVGCERLVAGRIPHRSPQAQTRPVGWMLLWGLCLGTVMLWVFGDAGPCMATHLTVPLFVELFVK